MISLDWNIISFLGFTGLALGLLCSLFLFYVWLKHRREQTFLLLWSIGLTLFYIFLIPFVRANFSETIVLANWNNFFISTVPLIFLGWVFVYSGITQITSSITGTPFLRAAMICGNSGTPGFFTIKSLSRKSPK